MNPNSLSTKQSEILSVLIRGNGFTPTGVLVACDLDQLLMRLSYSPTKQSMQFSIRALIRRGLVFRGEHENRRNRKRVLLVPTDLARKVISDRILSVITTKEPEVIPEIEDLSQILDGLS